MNPSQRDVDGFEIRVGFQGAFGCLQSQVHPFLIVVKRIAQPVGFRKASQAQMEFGIVVSHFLKQRNGLLQVPLLVPPMQVAHGFQVLFVGGGIGPSMLGGTGGL